jgi:vacuolar-type H+-ATPase subunit I/STV1
MTTTDEYGSSYDRPVTGWVGWIIFAAVFMVTVGAINVIQGLAALFRDDVYWETFRGDIVAFNITTWGWITLIFGILLIVTGVLLMQGSTFARVVGIGLVALNLINQFAWASFYPFWAIIVIAVDIVIIYALVVHGGELKQV